MENRGEPGATRGNANVVIGAILVGLGLLFFLEQTLGLYLGRYLWPFFVIVPGLAFFMAMVMSGRNGGPLAIPGSIVTTVGLILLYQNSFNRWESWAYAWALIPVAVGVGLMIHGAWSDRPGLREAGRRVAGVGVVLFLVFGAFFELALNLSGYWDLSRWFWPLLLIALGVYLLLRRGARSSE